jgi:hypothetical protein
MYPWGNTWSNESDNILRGQHGGDAEYLNLDTISYGQSANLEIPWSSHRDHFQSDAKPGGDHENPENLRRLYELCVHSNDDRPISNDPQPLNFDVSHDSTSNYTRSSGGIWLLQP